MKPKPIPRIDHRAPCHCAIEIGDHDPGVIVGENCRVLDDPTCGKRLTGGGWCLRKESHDGDCEGIREPATPRPPLPATPMFAGAPKRSPPKP